MTPRSASLLSLAAASSAAALLTAPTALSQGFGAPIVGRGMASITPAGVLVNGTPSLSNVRLKNAKDQNQPPAAWAPQPGTTDPDYDLGSLFSLWPELELDAISTGNATIPRHSGDGIPDLAASGSWMGVTVSVNNGDSGADGSHFEAAEIRGWETGGELATHYLADSVGLSPGLAGKTMLETTRVQFGLGPATNYDITGLDYALGVITFDVSRQAGSFFKFRDRVFFSVTADSADDINMVGPAFAQDLNGSGTATYQAHAGDVYMVRWLVSTATWDVPEIYLSHMDLGLGPGGDVDGLDVDTVNETAVYSTLGLNDFDTGVVNGPTSQLMIYQAAKTSGLHTAAQPPMRLNSTGGVGVDGLSGGIPLEGGSNDDEIDSVCVLDPEAYEFGTLIGTPVAYHDPYGTPAGISMVRGQYDATSPQDQLEIQITGWGAANPQNGTLQLFEGTGPVVQGMDIRQLPWTLIATRPRRRSHNKEYFTIPNLAAPSGIDTYYWAVGRNAAGQVIYASNVSAIER